MISGIAAAGVWLLIVLWADGEGGGLYDPDASADARHQQHKRQQRAAAWANIKKRVFS